MSFIFIVLAGYYWFIKDQNTVTWVFVLISAILLLLSYFTPKLLIPLCKTWFATGNFLGQITQPLILGFLFYFFITPVGVITRIFGRDELKLKKRGGSTYWVNRPQGKYSPNSFYDQF